MAGEWNREILSEKQLNSYMHLISFNPLKPTCFLQWFFKLLVPWDLCYASPSQNWAQVSIYQETDVLYRDKKSNGKCHLLKMCKGKIIQQISFHLAAYLPHPEKKVNVGETEALLKFDLCKCCRVEKVNSKTCMFLQPSKVMTDVPFYLNASRVMNVAPLSKSRTEIISWQGLLELLGTKYPPPYEHPTYKCSF